VEGTIVGQVKARRYGLRKCAKCYRYKPLSKFHKDKSKSDGFRKECVDCRSKTSKEYYNRPERKEVVSKYIEQHREARRRNTLKYMYGLTTENYEQLYLKLNGKCAICGKPEQRKSSSHLCVDHCHKTGKIRGLLCHKCNSGIGKLNDDVELLKKAISYLEYPW